MYQEQPFQNGKAGFHLDKDTTPFPRWLLLNRYSRRAGQQEKAVCAPWRGSVPPFLVGVSKGGNAPIWHTTLRRKV